MIDIHTHILPGIDDGVKEIEESLETLQELVKQGVTEIIATPHVISGTYDNTREIIEEKIGHLHAEISKQHIPIKIHYGAELYIEPNLLKKVKKNSFTLAQSDYVLVESALQRLPDNFENVIYNLQREGYKPIIAHVERFMPFMNNFNSLIKILNRGVYLQINAGSLLGESGQDIREFSYKLLENGCVHFVASDLHGIKKRPILLEQAFEFLTENFTRELAELLLRKNPRRIIHNEQIEGMLEEEYWDEPPRRKSIFKKIVNFLSEI